MLNPKCEVVVPVCDRRGRPTELDRFCGEPAYFRYLGLEPKPHAPPPVKLLMCFDHAKRILDEFGWDVHDRRQYIERLDMQALRIHCTQCLTFTKVVWDANAPSVNPGHIQYCPRCGHHQPAIIDPDADYWDVMSEAFDNMPTQLLQMLYQEWDRTKYSRFRDYVEAEISHFDEAGDLMANTAN